MAFPQEVRVSADDETKIPEGQEDETVDTEAALLEDGEYGPASTRNMVTLCDECHRDYHSGKLKIYIGTF